MFYYHQYWLKSQYIFCSYQQTPLLLCSHHILQLTLQPTHPFASNYQQQTTMRQPPSCHSRPQRGALRTLPNDISDHEAHLSEINTGGLDPLSPNTRKIVQVAVVAARGEKTRAKRRRQEDEELEDETYKDFTPMKREVKQNKRAIEELSYSVVDLMASVTELKREFCSAVGHVKT